MADVMMRETIILKCAARLANPPHPKIHSYQIMVTHFEINIIVLLIDFISNNLEEGYSGSVFTVHVYVKI